MLFHDKHLNKNDVDYLGASCAEIFLCNIRTPHQRAGDVAYSLATSCMPAS